MINNLRNTGVQTNPAGIEPSSTPLPSSADSKGEDSYLDGSSSSSVAAPSLLSVGGHLFFAPKKAVDGKKDDKPTDGDDNKEDKPTEEKPTITGGIFKKKETTPETPIITGGIFKKKDTDQTPETSPITGGVFKKKDDLPKETNLLDPTTTPLGTFEKTKALKITPSDDIKLKDLQIGDWVVIKRLDGDSGSVHVDIPQPSPAEPVNTILSLGSKDRDGTAILYTFQIPKDYQKDGPVKISSSGKKFAIEVYNSDHLPRVKYSVLVTEKVETAKKDPEKKKEVAKKEEVKKEEPPQVKPTETTPKPKEEPKTPPAVDPVKKPPKRGGPKEEKK